MNLQESIRRILKEETNPNKMDLYEFAKWGLTGEYEYSGCWDDKNDLDGAIECAVNDFEEFLNDPYPTGLGNIPKNPIIYRLIKLNEIKDLNKNNMGKSWFSNPNQINNPEFFDMLEYLKPGPNNKVFLIKGKTTINNIDLKRTLWERSTQWWENEIVIKDDSNIDILDIKELTMDKYLNRNTLKEEEDYSPAGKEIKPNSIIVHKSNPMFRDKIMEEGLKVRAGECYKTYVGYGIKCIPAIFATNSTNKRSWFDSTYDDDIWFIDTRMIPDVKWYKDRHYESTKKHIVTFQDIPKEAITLKYEGTGSGDVKTWPKDSPNLYESIRRILREDSLKNDLMGLIKNVGIKKASKAVGGINRLIKILDLNDEEVNDFIYQYLTEGFYPDYNWGPELHDFYQEDVKEYGMYEFLINDVPAYTYLGEWDGYDYLYTLSITKWIIDELTTMFGDKWIPVFKKWFEDNSGLEVREIDLNNRFNVL